MPNLNQFAMPDLGEGLTEGEIVEWRVSVGDVVAINDIIVAVETAKAVVELPSPYAGTVTELYSSAGQVVPVGAPIIGIADLESQHTETEQIAENEPTDTVPALREPSVATEEQREPVLVGYGVHRTSAARRPRKFASPGAVLYPAAVLVGPNQRAHAKPPVRKLARQLGLDLTKLPSTGPRGEVTRADVMAATAAATPSAATDPSEVRHPVSGMRRNIASAMVASAFTAPHVTEWISVDVTRSLALLKRLRADRALADLRITPLTLLARAALLALQRHREVNTSWDAAANEIVEYRDVNLGIAVASPRGLIVPNIRAAQKMSFPELAYSLNALIAAARENRTSPEQMRGGTFTITNIGVFGVDGATPILNPGEAAILCFGQVRKQPWEHNGKAQLRSVTTLSLSFDHRLVDGKLGSQMLADVARLIERPQLALAW
jgi:2-oxoisovalerate dehydrogenase E2 component (dihydrolipoyl transacylase)